MVTDINSEDRLVQATFAEHLEEKLGWENIYAWNQENFGLGRTLGRRDSREVVLTRDLQRALYRLNPHFPPAAVKDAIAQLTQHDFSRSLLQHNRDFYRPIRDGVPVSYRDPRGLLRTRRKRRTITHKEPLQISLHGEEGASAKRGVHRMETLLGRPLAQRPVCYREDEGTDYNWVQPE